MTFALLKVWQKKAFCSSVVSPLCDQFANIFEWLIWLKFNQIAISLFISLRKHAMIYSCNSRTSNLIRSCSNSLIYSSMLILCCLREFSLRSMPFFIVVGKNLLFISFFSFSQYLILLFLSWFSDSLGFPTKGKHTPSTWEQHLATIFIWVWAEVKYSFICMLPIHKVILIKANLKFWHLYFDFTVILFTLSFSPPNSAIRITIVASSVTGFIRVWMRIWIVRRGCRSLRLILSCLIL